MEMGHTQWPTLLQWRELTLLWLSMLMKRISLGKTSMVTGTYKRVHDHWLRKYYTTGISTFMIIPYFMHSFSLSDFKVLPTNDTKKLEVSAPGLQLGHCAKVPQTFTIGCSKNGEAPESVAIMTPSGEFVVP